MKNCNEMVNSLLERKEQYDLDRKRKKKILTRTLTPLCCAFAIAIIGIGAYHGGLFEKEPDVILEDAVNPGTKDWYGPGETPDDSPQEIPKDNPLDMIGWISYNGKRYVQTSEVKAEDLILDEKIGVGDDFEGYYSKEWLKGIYEKRGYKFYDEYHLKSEVYTVRDNTDLLCVSLENGAKVVLRLEKQK